MIFVVPGKPQGKARPRTVRNKYTGGVHSYTPAGTVQYEKSVQEAYLMARDRERWMDKEPLSVYITAHFEIPKSYSKSMKKKALMREISPVKKPDLDNIAKAICDALNGLAYKDDSQIVELYIGKGYTSGAPYVRVGIEKYFDEKEISEEKENDKR